MKKMLLPILGVLCLMMASVAFASSAVSPAVSPSSTVSGAPAKGGFKGPGPAKTTVAEAIKLRDDSPVTLQGYIVERLGDERYTFKDTTGTVIIEIDDDNWGGLEVTPENEVVIEGEVEKKRSSVKIEVDRIRFAN